MHMYIRVLNLPTLLAEAIATKNATCIERESKLRGIQTAVPLALLGPNSDPKGERILHLWVQSDEAFHEPGNDWVGEKGPTIHWGVKKPRWQPGAPFQS